MSKGFLDTIAFENEKCVIVTGCDASQLQLDAGRVGILVCIWLLDLRTLGSTSMAVPPMAKKKAVLTRRLSQCSESKQLIFLIRDLWMCGITPPPAMVALMRVSSSSSPRMASCKWRGVMRFTFKSLDAFPASSSTSAHKYSQMA